MQYFVFIVAFVLAALVVGVDSWISLYLKTLRGPAPTVVVMFFPSSPVSCTWIGSGAGVPYPQGRRPEAKWEAKEVREVAAGLLSNADEER